MLELSSVEGLLLDILQVDEDGARLCERKHQAARQFPVLIGMINPVTSADFDFVSWILM